MGELIHDFDYDDFNLSISQLVCNIALSVQ